MVSKLNEAIDAVCQAGAYDTDAPAITSAETMFQVGRMAGEAFCKSVRPPRAASCFPGFAIAI